MSLDEPGLRSQMQENVELSVRVVLAALQDRQALCGKWQLRGYQAYLESDTSTSRPFRHVRMPGLACEDRMRGMHCTASPDQ